MKRIFPAILAACLFSCAAHAQSYDDGNYYNERTSRYSGGYKTFPSRYYGFRVGVNSAHISAKDDFHSCNHRARLNLGVTVGYGLTSSAPLYFETGLSYTAKGGKKTVAESHEVENYDGELAAGKYEYNLDYLQIPFVMKYICSFDGGFGIQPFFGGYFSCGLAGSIKNYDEKKSYSSFSDRDEAFHRFDAGLRFGVGLSYEIAYIDFACELGLSNINHDAFQPAHNRNLLVTFGVNF